MPTLGYCISHPALPPSDAMALCTMNILPPMMTVWYHFARRAVGDDTDIVIFDCSGKLKKKDFPGAMVLPFLNLYAATKCDEFLKNIARKRRIGWICDDDMFLLSSEAKAIVSRELSDPQTASVSFRPRDWWHFEIDGKKHEASSSYCIAYNREIFVDREHLSLAPREGNTHPDVYGKGKRRYDTADYANEMLLRKGYRCYVVPEEDRDKYVTGFSGMSGAVMLLNYFKTPEQTLDYFRLAPEEGWKSGTLLHGVLCAMLSVSHIQSLHTTLTGSPYPLPSLPSHSDLERLREAHRNNTHGGEAYDEVERVATILRAKL